MQKLKNLKMKVNVEKKLNGKEYFHNCLQKLNNYTFSLRTELQDAEAEDLAGGKDITKDNRRRQR
jgi:hypothetical protein